VGQDWGKIGATFSGVADERRILRPVEVQLARKLLACSQYTTLLNLALSQHGADVVVLKSYEYSEGINSSNKSFNVGSHRAFNICVSLS